MSQRLINLSPDLQKLRDEGYSLEIRGSFLLVHDVPYVGNSKEVKSGTLVMELSLAGDVTTQPATHVAHFIGQHPCNTNGVPIAQIQNSSSEQNFGSGVVVQHTFSAKPVSTGRYLDYYHKVTTYVTHITSHAQSLDPSVTAKVFKVVETTPGEGSPFLYLDTASSRAGVAAITEKLQLNKVVIIGLGGTGAYVLDLIAKTPVKEIHLYDGDTFLQHNAFRSPGAASIEDLRLKHFKVSYFEHLYGKMRTGMISHPTYIEERNVEELIGADFIFLCLDRGSSKQVIIEKLLEAGVPFCDVGIGVPPSEGDLSGILRVTTVTAQKCDHVDSYIQLTDVPAENEYSRNIQIADLNALNATLAVIKFKKMFGFYRDLSREHNSFFTIDTNQLDNSEISA